MSTFDEVPVAVRELAKRLAEPRPMRRGSVSERSMKCGKSGCRCQEDPNARHGPYFTITRVEGGKTRSRYLDAERAALARQQVEAGHGFRRLVEAYWESCERWANTELELMEATSQEVAKKGGSKRPSKAKSSQKSKR